MAKKFWYYMNWGAGSVEVTSYDNALKLSWSRQINDVVAIDAVKGKFTLYDADYTAAYTFFITNANYEVPFRIYENGAVGVGTLVYDGFGRAKYKYDISKEVMSINNFRTDNPYLDIIDLWDVKKDLYTLIALDSGIKLRIQGQNANCNKIQRYTLSGPTWTVTGNSLAIPNLPRCAMTKGTNGIIIFDPITGYFSEYQYSAPNWTMTANTLVIIYGGGNATIEQTSSGANSFFVLLSNGYIDTVTLTGTTFAGSGGGGSYLDGNVLFPSMCRVNLAATVYAIVDETTGEIRTFPAETSVSVGIVKRPRICKLDPINNTFAFIDAKNKMLKCYTYSAGSIVQTGEGFYVGDIKNPDICWAVTNSIILSDSASGIVQQYLFVPATGLWSAINNNLSISGGYFNAVEYWSGGIISCQSDTYFLNCYNYTFRSVINALFQKVGLTAYSIPVSNGCTIDLDKLTYTDTQDITNSVEDRWTTKTSIKQLFDVLELLQNYWYLDGTDIKFTQPDQFTSFGSDVTAPAGALDLLNTRELNDNVLINRENIVFKNEDGEEFVGVDILYNRNTPAKKEATVNITTDLQYLQDVFEGVTDKKLDSSGITLFYEDDSALLVPSDTGILSGNDTKNNKLSKSNIQDEYLSDYRYVEKGNITINGTPVAVGATVRELVLFSNLKMKMANFPTSIANIDWGSGIFSYITKLELDLNTYSTEIESRLLDL